MMNDFFRGSTRSSRSRFGFKKGASSRVKKQKKRTDPELAAVTAMHAQAFNFESMLKSGERMSKP